MEIHLRTVVVDCEDAHRAAHFYSKLLGWPITLEEPDWGLLRDPKGGTGLSFQTEEDYVRPVWPEEPGLSLIHIFPELQRAITRREQEKVEDALFALGLEGFTQERAARGKQFIPDWNL